MVVKVNYQTAKFNSLWLHSIMAFIISQVNETFSHLKFYVIIHPMAVSGLESYAHWMNTWLAVA